MLMNFSRFVLPVAIAGFFVSTTITSMAQKEVKFTKQVLTNDFIAEGVAVADVNKDGKMDVLAGTHWFQAPGWQKHDLDTPAVFKTTEYSRSFLHFADDINKDGWPDLITIGFPGEPATWLENPGKKKGYWKKHLLYSSIGNESPAYADLNGDRKKEVIGNDSKQKKIVWVGQPASKNNKDWQAHVVSNDSLLGTHQYTHGLGTGDMNLDGRNDLIIREGWWEAPADATQADWTFHRANLGKEAAQMYVMDLDGDGDQDVISSSAHNYGIWWHEQLQQGDTIAWQQHEIFTEFSQTHGLALKDINGDGHPDLITGKRYFAHNGHDPGANDPAVLYWFEFKPGKQPAWIPHLVDSDSGAGLNLVVEDINKDKLVDIVISNKKGVFVFLQQKNK